MNCYLLEDAGEALVVDPGEASGSLLAALDDLRVRAIINTHGHCDHCGGNAGLKRATGAPLLAHKDDLQLIQLLEEQGRMFGVPFPSSPDPDRFLAAGDEVAVGDASVTVRHVPGHSPGHIALVGDGFAVVGDVVFAGSIGRTDLPGGSQAQLIESIQREILSLPDDTVLYPGHGPATTVGQERRTNPFLAGP
jgi:glyoxylase-like metal-dependent hydrolase (beta-lactamase superfamily II)